MQMLAERSEEGRRPGLGWIAGEVKRFDVTRFSQQTPLPHMGWNGVRPLASTGLFENLGPDSEFYFLHSYYFAPAEEEFILSLTDYGGGFASSVSSGNIFGVQFHPEKSHGWGIQLLLNFGSIRPCCVQE
jgi:glutamine amidotransferase